MFWTGQREWKSEGENAYRAHNHSIFSYCTFKTLSFLFFNSCSHRYRSIAWMDWYNFCERWSVCKYEVVNILIHFHIHFHIHIISTWWNYRMDWAYHQSKQVPTIDVVWELRYLLQKGRCEWLDPTPSIYDWQKREWLQIRPKIE